VDRFAEAVGESVARSRQAAAARARRRGEPLAIGDLFVCAATREFPIEWLVVDRDRRAPGRLLVLLADTNSLFDTTDLVVPAGAGAGPLSLRCRYAAWLAEGALDPELRTGSVAPEIAAQALRRHRELAANPVGDGQGEKAAVADAQLEDWVDEILVPAHAALTEAHAAQAAAAGAVPEGTAVAAGLPPPARGRLDLLAASILLLVVLGLGAAVLWQHRELSRLGPERARMEVALRRERAEASAAGARAESTRRELERATRDGEAARRALEERIAALERPTAGGGGSGDLVANVPFLWLQPREALRGELAATPRPAHSPYLLLILELGDADPFREYRLEVSRAGEPGVLWRIAGLEKTGLTELTVALPSRLLKAGEYRLRLYAPGGRAPVREYALAVRPG
jgi:hypothetical protein